VRLVLRLKVLERVTVRRGRVGRLSGPLAFTELPEMLVDELMRPAIRVR
jgi:hypothetical protein